MGLLCLGSIDRGRFALTVCLFVFLFVCFQFSVDLSTLVGCCYTVYIRRITHFILFLMHVLLIPQLFRLYCREGQLGTRKPVQVNHISWTAVAIPIDRPKSVRNFCVIEVFGGVLCCAFVNVLLVKGLLS